MIKYASLPNYNIEYNKEEKLFYITSKEDRMPIHKAYDTPAKAIDHAEDRFIANGLKP